MKKIFVGLVLFVLFASFVSAEDVDNQTQAFDSNLGARMRMLQLKDSVEKNIMWGEVIIEYMGTDADGAADLATILEELKALRDEIDDANPQSGQDGAQAFVDLKKDALELSREFRELARTIIPKGEADELKENLKEASKDWNQQKKERIQETRREYNAERAEKLLGSLGVDDPALIEKILSGDAKKGDLNSAVRSTLKDMNKTDRKEALQTLKEEHVKGAVFARVVADKVAYQKLERDQARIEKRLGKLDTENMSDEMKEKIQKRTMMIETRMSNIEDRAQKRSDHIENITDKKIDRIDMQKDKIENRSANQIAKMTGRLEVENLTQKQVQRMNQAIEKVQIRTEKATGQLTKRAEKVQEVGAKLQGKVANVGGKR